MTAALTIVWAGLVLVALLMVEFRLARIQKALQPDPQPWRVRPRGIGEPR